MLDEESIFRASPLHTPNACHTIWFPPSYHHYIITFTRRSYSQLINTLSYIHIIYLQSASVAASTISMLMLSLDRYATVKHPRLAQLRQRRYLPMVLATGAWISAIILSIPILLAYRVAQPSLESVTTVGSMAAAIATSKSTNHDASSTNFFATSPLPELNFNQSNHIRSTTCQPDYGTAQLHNAFIAIHTLFVFILPGIGVLLNHLGVRKKLCALSLTARAAHGELPLPMPILRRPTHMIIVTGMANAAAVRDDDDSSNDDNQDKGERRFMMDSTRMRTTPRTPRWVIDYVCGLS